MQALAKLRIFFNTLGLAAGVAALALAGAGPAAAVGGEPGSDREARAIEPVLHVEAPDGYCLIDAPDAGRAGFSTGFEPGLKSGTVLLALYVPCPALEAARAGTAEWLPEWVAIEKNTVTYPSDDARSLGTHGAVQQLCRDAQSAQWGHPKYEGVDFAEMVKAGSAKLSYEQPEIFLGVIGEEEHACYLSSLRIVFSPSGKPQRFLIVTAFMQAGDRWVTQSFRRELGDVPGVAEAIFTAAKTHSKTFADRNR
jgi:hypothetical protein